MNFPFLESYHIIEEIGRGGFGVVYKARKIGTGKIVAIKVIPKRGKREPVINNLRQEITIMKKLKHKNIIELYDVRETEKSFYIVMEHGISDLVEMIKSNENPSEHEVLVIAKQLINSLKYIHSNRVIHRDLKPSNILISQNGNIKICDFGFARALSEKTFVLTSVKGSPLYIAPEVIKETGYNFSCDIWSMGVILYELWFGVPPFNGNNYLTVFNKIASDEVCFSLKREISEKFKSFLTGLLQKEPKNRFSWKQIEQHSFVKQKKRILNHYMGEKQRIEKMRAQYFPESPKLKPKPKMAKKKNIIPKLCLQKILAAKKNNPNPLTGQITGANTPRMDIQGIDEVKIRKSIKKKSLKKCITVDIVVNLLRSSKNEKELFKLLKKIKQISIIVINFPKKINDYKDFFINMQAFQQLIFIYNTYYSLQSFVLDILFYSCKIHSKLGNYKKYRINLESNLLNSVIFNDLFLYFKGENNYKEIYKLLLIFDYCFEVVNFFGRKRKRKT